MSKTLRADDRRKNYHKVEADDEKSESGHANRLAGVYHDRRMGHGKSHALGKGKRAN